MGENVSKQIPDECPYSIDREAPGAATAEGKGLAQDSCWGTNASWRVEIGWCKNLLIQPMPNMAAPVAAGTILEETKERIDGRMWPVLLKKAELVRRLSGFILNVLVCCM